MSKIYMSVTPDLIGIVILNVWTKKYVIIQKAWKTEILISIRINF